MTSFWNILFKNRRQSFTGMLVGCTFDLPKPGVRPPVESEIADQPNEEARIEHNDSVATAGFDQVTPRMEGFVEVSATNVVKAI